MKRLIVTADDFGRAIPVNEAVEDANKRGILTAASLMVTGDAVDDAVERARRSPGLAVGLHITLVDGAPALPAAQIPALVGRDGRFTVELVRLGTRIYLSPAVRRQVEAELRAQFELFRATGLKLAHIDAHHHYHLHPTVFDILLGLAVEYGAPGIRVPWEPPLVSWRARGENLRGRMVNGLFHARRAMRMRRLIEKAGMVANDYVFGVNDSGAMDQSRFEDFIGALPEGLSELYCHPATRRWSLRPLPERYRTEDEYAAMIAPSVRALIEKRGIVLTSFAAEAARRQEGRP